MDIPLLYSKINRQLPYGIQGYRLDNPEYLDPRKAIIMRQAQQILKTKKKGKFKASKRNKPCFMDEHTSLFKYIPGPGAYKLSRSQSAPNKLKPKIDLKASKNTYIDQIVFDYEKYKKPGVGKYNISKSLEKQKEENLKLSRKKLSYGEKIGNLDNVWTLASEVPGVGQYNLGFRRKIKKENRDQDYYKKKTKEEGQRQRAKTARPDPASYEPVPAMFKTFGSIERDNKSKTQISRWSHGTIDKRPTSTGFLVSPGPAQHDLTNNWTKDLKNPKENLNFKILNRLSKGYKPGVYH